MSEKIIELLKAIRSQPNPEKALEEVIEALEKKGGEGNA